MVSFEADTFEGVVATPHYQPTSTSLAQQPSARENPADDCSPTGLSFLSYTWPVALVGVLRTSLQTVQEQRSTGVDVLSELIRRAKVVGDLFKAQGDA